jgi:hypothetical protein
MLCFHAVGMGIVVGISFMCSARILGYAKDFPLSAFDRLFSPAWFGFAANAVSGVVLYFGEPRRLLATPAFWIKMIMIALGACQSLTRGYARLFAPCPPGSAGHALLCLPDEADHTT